jgi:enolase-phosphatase E1
LDIEGTTTSISFVYDELFPFVRAELGAFLTEHWGRADVQADVGELRKQAEADVAAGLEGACLLPEPDSGGQALREAASAIVAWQMDSDRKTTALKALQGKIWVNGYQSGALKGHLFSDVAPAMRQLVELGKSIYIYSSGSVAAQKLLFGHSIEGDLTPSISGYFDTTTGPKKVATSYRVIAEAIGSNADQILFLTDSLDEALAAREAGLRVRLSLRPGNHPLPEHDFRTITSFADLF